MEQEISSIDEQMKVELKEVKEKYASLKADVKNKYKAMEKQKKKVEKEETKKLRKSIPKSLKILVWDKNIGKEKGIGECVVCESDIDSKNFECGHIKSVKENGSTTIDNLLPICSVCNKSMGTQNLHEFKAEFFPENMKDKVDKVKKLDKVKKVDIKSNGTHVDEFIHHKLRKTDEMNIIHEYQPVLLRGPDYDKLHKFMSLDTIYSMYRSWLRETYRDHYDSTQFAGCFGEDTEKTELKDKLTETFGEYTSDPNPRKTIIHNHFDYLNQNPMGDFLSQKGFGFRNICVA